MPRPWFPTDPNDFRKRYLAGESEQHLAKTFHITRGTARRVLIGLGVEPRGRREAMNVRMAHTSADERKRLTAAAHSAVRGRTVSTSELERKALARQRSGSKIGSGELTLAAWLTIRGLRCILQQAVGPYNVDIGCEPIAIEVHVTTSNPSRIIRCAQRSEYLLSRGWSVLYVWVSHNYFLQEVAADEVVAFRERAQRLPSGGRQYGVIRGTGKLITELVFDRDEVAVIPRSKAHLKTPRD